MEPYLWDRDLCLSNRLFFTRIFRINVTVFYSVNASCHNDHLTHLYIYLDHVIKYAYFRAYVRNTYSFIHSLFILLETMEATLRWGIWGGGLRKYTHQIVSVCVCVKQ